MEQLSTGLQVAVAMLAIVGALSPIFAGYVFWKLQQRFATRGALRSSFRRLNTKIDEKVATLDNDMKAALQRVEKRIDDKQAETVRAVQNVQERIRADINGLGEKWTATQKLAELSVEQADEARHNTEILDNKVNSIDEHGTRAMRNLSDKLNDVLIALNNHQHRGGK